MDTRPLTCPRCDASSAGTARFCAECGQDLRAAVPANQHRSRHRLAGAVTDRLTRITAGFARLVLALAGGAVVFFAGLVAFALAGWANSSDWAPRLAVFIAACAAILTVGWRSEALFERRPRFCPHCGEPLRTAASATHPPARSPRAMAPVKSGGVRGVLDAFGHDALILVAALMSGVAMVSVGDVLVGELGLLSRLGRWTATVGWLVGCAGFAVVFFRYSYIFRARRWTRGRLANISSFAVALAGAILALLTISAVFYFGRLDIAFPSLRILTFLAAPVALLFLYTWPRLYRPLVRTPIRTVGSATVALSLIAGQGYAIENVPRSSACDPLYANADYQINRVPDGYTFLDATSDGVDALDGNGVFISQFVDLHDSRSGSSGLGLFPDRKRIVFDMSTNYTDGSGPGDDILSADLDGSHLRVLVSGYPDVLNWSPVVDPSGTSVYFLRAEPVTVDGRTHRHRSIERLDLATKKCSRVASVGDVGELALSPDGATLAYVQLDDDYSLWRMRTDGSDPHAFFGADDTWVGVREVQFSPDSSSVAFVAESREPHPAIGQQPCGCGFIRPLELFVAPSNGGGARAFAATDSMPFGRPTWSPDGTRIAFTDNFGWVEIVTVADGSVRTLTGRVVSPELLWVKNVER